MRPEEYREHTARRVPYTRLTNEQVAVLEETFMHKPSPDHQTCVDLAEELEIDTERVYDW